MFQCETVGFHRLGCQGSCWSMFSSDPGAAKRDWHASPPVPARGADFAYIAWGTWSLVGMELDRPELTEAGRLANFRNEGRH
jgi:hypothetical protein